jgi:hypothetical protein
MSLIIPQWINAFYDWTDATQKSWTEENAEGFEAVMRGFIWVAHKSILFFVVFLILALEINYYPKSLIGTGILVVAIEIFHAIGTHR